MNAAETDQYGINYLERSALLRSLGVEATFMGIGVDRVDYTKGILERFRRDRAVSREVSQAIRENSPSCRSARPAALTSSAITI